MSERGLQTVYKYPIYPRVSKNYSDDEFVNIHDGSQGGSQWTCFIMKDNKSYDFGSLGGPPGKNQQNQLPKPRTYHSYEIQDIYSELCGSFCLYFFLFN